MRSMTLLPILVFLVPLASGIPPARAATPPGDPTSAPVATLRLLPYRKGVAVQVRANGAQGLFTLDTAGGHSIASPAFAKAAGCKPWGQLAGYTMTGTRLEMPRCDNFQLLVDGTPLTAPVAGVMDVAPLLAKDAAPIAGLLALDVFAGRTITLDFAGGSLYIESPASAARRIAGARELPILMEREAGGHALAVSVQVASAKGPIGLELDSGNGGTLLVSKPYAALLGLDPDVDGPQQAAFDVAPGIRAKGLVFLPDMTIDGNLGMPFLKDWIVTLDLAEGRMWLRPNPVKPPAGMGVPPPLPAR